MDMATTVTESYRRDMKGVNPRDQAILACLEIVCKQDAFASFSVINTGFNVKIARSANSSFCKLISVCFYANFYSLSAFLWLSSTNDKL